MYTPFSLYIKEGFRVLTAVSWWPFYEFGQDNEFSKCLNLWVNIQSFPGVNNFHPELFPSSDKEQLVEEEDDELKEVLDLRKIAVQLLQQEQQNRCVGLTFL